MFSYVSAPEWGGSFVPWLDREVRIPRPLEPGEKDLKKFFKKFQKKG